MKSISIVAAIAIILLVAATLVPESRPFMPYIQYAALAASALLLIVVIAWAKSELPSRQAVAEAAPPPAPLVEPNPADAQVVGFLATLQDKGRLVDFLMDDVTAYKDAQVGAAARVVHEGCKRALKEHFDIRPIREESEGSAVTVTPGYAADEYRFVGQVRGEPPFSGTLVHRGWKTGHVKLPRVVTPRGDRLPTIAPAEVELK